MLFLGHAGLTLAAARVMEKMMVPGGRQRTGGRPGPPELIDYRLVLIGSMLPDIIDKPLGGVIFKETLGNGRIYAHTLVFLLFAWAAGLLWWRRYRRPGAWSWPGVACCTTCWTGCGATRLLSSGPCTAGVFPGATRKSGSGSGWRGSCTTLWCMCRKQPAVLFSCSFLDNLFTGKG
ncbi:metal-dependent hydrolase [Neomoorella thermoacetica]|uniref:metal-dependent hydrolase n=1 Tax=Neomoorella thermoacetica TaxID=1525 RepID=UPI000AE60056|nr:metal-dependent hydrolase [Moorella thermoacetica]